MRIDLAENVRRIGSAPLLNKPGDQWRYSLAIDVLGAVVEKAAEQYETFVRMGNEMSDSASVVRLYEDRRAG